MIKEPKEYPYECLDDDGEDTRVIGKSMFAPGLYVCEIKTDNDSFVCRRYLSELFDKPKVTSVWWNLYPDRAGINCVSRKVADKHARPDRIGVLRIDTIDGVSTPHLEEI